MSQSYKVFRYPMEQRNHQPSRLQRDLLPEILSMIRTEGLEPGCKLVELSIASRLGVSRTPVRAALNHLADLGVARRAARGFTLAAVPEADIAAEAPGEDAPERLSLSISRDWMGGLLPADLSEADLMRRYAASRGLLTRALSQLEQLGVVERKRGPGWHFQPAIIDRAPITIAVSSGGAAAEPVAAGFQVRVRLCRRPCADDGAGGGELHRSSADSRRRRGWHDGGGGGVDAVASAAGAIATVVALLI